MPIEVITIASIDEVIQLREKPSQRTVDEYAEVYREAHRTKKSIMPPITVFRTEEIREGKDCARSIAVNIVGDGAHRLEGVRLAGLKTIEADVRFGSREDAVLYAAGCNAAHGLRRTPSDKRKAVEWVLRNAEWAKKSDRWIAGKCCVSHPFVAEVRRSLQGQLETLPVESEAKRIGQDGKARKPRRTPGKNRRWCPICGECSVAVGVPACSKCASENLPAPAPAAEPLATATATIAPVDDEPCSVCQTGIRVDGDRCQKCIDTNHYGDDDGELLGIMDDDQQPDVTVTGDQVPESKGVGVQLAHEAIAALKRIPEADALRSRAFEIVRDWMDHNE